MQVSRRQERMAAAAGDLSLEGALMQQRSALEPPFHTGHRDPGLNLGRPGL